MHILAEQIRSLDETVQAVELGQTPAEAVILSFSDSDLGLAAATHATLGPDAPTLRLASLAALRHPYSVDRYVETVARHARVVIVRCLGGADYWRYGLDELAVAARAHGVDLAALPGDGRPDARLNEASTLPPETLRRLAGWFDAGGPANMRALFGWISTRLGRPAPHPDPVPLPALGCWPEACGCGGACRAFPAGEAPATARPAVPGRPVALVLFYRSHLSAGDAAPVAAVAAALSDRGLLAVPVFVTSLKDPAVVAPLEAALDRLKPAVVLNATAFSATLGDGGSVIDRAGVPVIQTPVAATFREAWAAGGRGLSAADLAMNVVLPEVDGRIDGPALSFKADSGRSEALQFTRVVHRPEPDGVARAADLAAAWVRLAGTPRSERRVALVLSDYPVKGGRAGYAVGLDGPASLAAIADDLRAAGYGVDALPPPDRLIRDLETGVHAVGLPLSDYAALFAALPAAFRDAVTAVWGDPADDPAVTSGQDVAPGQDGEAGAFRFKALVAGRLAVAVQPDRGLRSAREGDYHDGALPPRHAYVAFHLWLRHRFRLDALVHLGTHGTLEWLPGKAVALTPACGPAALLPATPVVYPFIVNNPGEAAQAKRRIGAVTVGHLTPPLARAGAHGATAEIEALLDEFSAAQSLDPRRAKRLAEVILEKARDSGLAAETGLAPDLDEAAALARLDAFVCDLKDMRIGDGLHVFGRAPDPARAAATAEAIGADPDRLAALLRRSAEAERAGLLAALDGRFVPPGPAGAPTGGRLDVLPTGRNLFSVDPRTVPTRVAHEIGARVAEEVIARYLQDHGDWPRRVVLDLWGSATMRTGGDDLAQAFALIGVRPTWDAASARVSGFEILASARLGRPRVDVTLRISGLFRDVFPTQIALFDEAARAVAALDEDDETNPLKGRADPRIFGAAPGAYGVGLSARIAADDWTDRADLGETYLAATVHAYGGASAEAAPSDAFRTHVATADAYVHVADLQGRDLLDGDAFADHEGGFAAAAHALNAAPALYHVDATGPATAVRTVPEEIARVVRARATNPRWIAGQMRHGHRGAAEIAETVGNLLAFSATADAVAAHQFEMVFDATLGDDRVRDFLVAANPSAAAACARAFDRAIRRGLWVTRRNSVAGRIAETLEAGP
ncbi:cobaltochelatase subunit CobN [Chthonobacter rhizosphaerae]|uniref:cobaltochelatase subunit CobN n=1 Tax=Chthonobacter rhizosphaerae TaxID=2735553 RepID=UPI0015EECA8A|nr:cobaltochelatase subunit CobN [Chthonobacter rhizosphaerae]